MSNSIDALYTLRNLEEEDKQLRHKPVKLYCLGCGKMINDHFTGGLWSYTHTCNLEELKDDFDKPHICCVVFGSELGILLPSSIIMGYKSYAKCITCKNEQEHIKKVLEGCLGKGFINRKMPSELVENLRKEAILKITMCSSKAYYEKVPKFDIN